VNGLLHRGSHIVELLGKAVLDQLVQLQNSLYVVNKLPVFFLAVVVILSVMVYTFAF
jgi:hypothetical protein